MMGNVHDSWETLIVAVEQGFQDQAWERALDLVHEGLTRFPEQSALLKYYQMCLLVRLGRNEVALNCLREQLQAGIWYSEEMLRKGPSLAPVQGLPAFEELIAWNHRLREEARAAGPVVEILEPDSLSRRPPLLIALHGNVSQATLFISHWRPAQAAGWLVAAPQSSQAYWSGACTWDDQALATEELQAHYLAFLERYPVDPGMVVLAGHSMGGQLALRAALSNHLPVRGFLLVGPYFPDLAEWGPMIEGARGRALRGYVLMNTGDSAIPQDNVRALVEWLCAAGIACEIEFIPASGHEIPADFGTYLIRALDFIGKEQNAV